MVPDEHLPRRNHRQTGLKSSPAPSYTETPIIQGVGYAVVLGFGLFFAALTTFLVWLEQRFGGVVYDSEHFSTAGRSIRCAPVSYSHLISLLFW